MRLCAEMLLLKISFSSCELDVFFFKINSLAAVTDYTKLCYPDFSDYDMSVTMGGIKLNCKRLLARKAKGFHRNPECSCIHAGFYASISERAKDDCEKRKELVAEELIAQKRSAQWSIGEKSKVTIHTLVTTKCTKMI